MQIPHLPRTLSKSKSTQPPNRNATNLPRCKARNERRPVRLHPYYNYRYMLLMGLFD
jgi:hypothetical protein